MTPQESFSILDEVYKGNFLSMPFDENLEHRSAMRQAIREREHMADALRALCKLDLYFLTHSVLGFTDTVPHVHKTYADHLVANPKKAVLMMPRGYFKSSVGTIGRVTQILLNDPNRRILIVNATATLAEKFVRKIGSFFTSCKQLRDLFPELIPTNFKKVKWCDNAIEINRTQTFVEASVEAVGVGGTSVGRHYTDIFFDDLVNEDHIASVTQMDKVVEWYKLACGSLGVKGGFNAIHNATRWAYYDVMSWVLENEPDAKVFHLSCYNENGESTFPEIYPTEELKKLEVIKGPTTFAAQFLNDPIPAGSQIFKPEWIQYYESLPDRAMRNYLVVDPAISEGKEACQRVVLIVSVDEDYNWYIRDYYAGFDQVWTDNKAQPSLVGEIFRLQALYQTSFNFFEEVGFQKALSYLVYKEMSERQQWFTITPVKPTNKQTKEMRIETLASPFGTKKVFLQRWMTELYKQLVGYPAYRYKDVVDALSYMMQFAWPTSVAEVKETFRENTLADIHKRIDNQYVGNVLEFRRPLRLRREEGAVHATSL